MSFATEHHHMKTPALCKRPEPRKERQNERRDLGSGHLPPSTPSAVSSTSTPATIPRATATRSASRTVWILLLMMTNRRSSTLQLGAEFLEALAHIRISHMHLSEEVIRQSSVIIKSAEVGATDVAHLQFLVAGRSGGILEVLQITLGSFLLVFRGANLVHLVQSHCDGASFAENGDLKKARIDRVVEIGYLLELWKVSDIIPDLEQA